MGAKCEACGVEQTGLVPLTRFQEVVSERESAKATLAETQAAMATHQQTAEQLSSQIQGYQASSQKHEMERTAWRAGLTDDEGMQVAALMYGNLDAADRPAFGDWLKAPPRAVAAYFAPTPPPQLSSEAPNVQDAQPAAAPPTAPQPKQFPNTSAGVTTTPVVEWSKERIASLTPEQYRQHRDEINASRK